VLELYFKPLFFYSFYVQIPTPSNQSSIELFGVTIIEPMVTFTDFWISAVCIYAFYKLVRMRQEGLVFRYMRLYFIIMAVATFLAGVLGHALQDMVGPGWKLPGWFFSMLAISCIERATIMHLHPLINPKFARFLEITNIIELVIFSTVVFSSLNFFYVQVQSVYGLGFVVLPLHFYAYLKTKNEGSRIFFLTVCFASIASFSYSMEIGINKWFNHLDVSHAIMALSMFFFYIGTKKLRVFTKADVLENTDSFTKTIKSALRPIFNQ